MDIFKHVCMSLWSPS